MEAVTEYMHCQDKPVEAILGWQSSALGVTTADKIRIVSLTFLLETVEEFVSLILVQHRLRLVATHAATAYVQVSHIFV